MKLAIEVDGSIHEGELEKAMDHERQSMLEKNGIKFLRFRNYEIMQQFTEVIKKIDEAIDKWSIDISQ